MIELSRSALRDLVYSGALAGEPCNAKESAELRRLQKEGGSLPPGIYEISGGVFYRIDVSPESIQMALMARQVGYVRSIRNVLIVACVLIAIVGFIVLTRP